MPSVTIIIQEQPYINFKAWDALRFAGGALAEDLTVRVFLLDKGIELGMVDHVVPENETNIQALMVELIECGLEVQACGKSMGDRQLDESGLLAGVTRSSMKALAQWVKDSTNVLTF